MRPLPGEAGKEEKVGLVRKLLPLFSIPVVFLSDRLLKNWSVEPFAEGQSLPVWRGVFHITRVNNAGAAFGLFKNAVFFLIIVSIVCIAFLTWSLFSQARADAAEPASPSGLGVLASSLVIAGALGNLYDRVFYGYVIDFLDFRVWPVFNIADAGITIGVGLIILSLFERRKSEKDVS